MLVTICTSTANAPRNTSRLEQKTESKASGRRTPKPPKPPRISK